jgi:spermidine synthase
MTRRVELLRDLERESGWVLLVDGVEQSYVDTADPRHLEFEYMQHMALVVDAVHTQPEPVTAVHLGGGALTLPRWLAETRPGSRQTVVETAEDVLRTVEPLGPVPRCRLLRIDAIDALAGMAARSADLVLWDLYDGPLAVMSALSLEAVTAMRRVLRRGGLLVLNVSDVAPFDVVRPVLAAVGQLFDDALLLAEPSTLRGRRSGNCVLAGSVGRSLPLSTLVTAAARAPVRGRVIGGEDLDEFVGAAVAATADRPLPPPDPRRGRGFL